MEACSPGRAGEKSASRTQAEASNMSPRWTASHLPSAFPPMINLSRASLLVSTPQGYTSTHKPPVMAACIKTSHPHTAGKTDNMRKLHMLLEPIPRTCQIRDTTRCHVCTMTRSVHVVLDALRDSLLVVPALASALSVEAARAVTRGAKLGRISSNDKPREDLPALPKDDKRSLSRTSPWLCPRQRIFRRRGSNESEPDEGELASPVEVESRLSSASSLLAAPAPTGTGRIESPDPCEPNEPRESSDPRVPVEIRLLYTG